MITTKHKVAHAATEAGLLSFFQGKRMSDNRPFTNKPNGSEMPPGGEHAKALVVPGRRPAEKIRAMLTLEKATSQCRAVGLRNIPTWP